MEVRTTGRSSSTESWLSRSRPPTKQPLRANAPPAESLRAAAGAASAALPAGASAEAAARRGLFIGRLVYREGWLLPVSVAGRRRRVGCTMRARRCGAKSSSFWKGHFMRRAAGIISLTGIVVAIALATSFDSPFGLAQGRLAAQARQGGAARA